MIEYNLIKLLLKKDYYLQYYSLLLSLVNDASLKKLVYALDEMHKTLEGDGTLDELKIVFYTNYPALKDAEKQIYDAVFSRIAESDADEAIISDYLAKMREKSFAHRMAVELLEVEAGNKPISSVLDAIKSFGDTNISTDEFKFVTDDLNELFNNHANKRGLRWRLKCLNNSLGSLRTGDFGFIFARPECFAKGTKVLLHTGRMINIEDIKQGMKVMGPDSTPRHVIATSKGKEKMYRVTLVNGDSYVCNESHVLQLRRNGNEYTQVKVKDYLNWSPKLKHGFKQYKVGVDFPHKDVVLDPYVLGLWLGDGTSSCPAFTNADPEVIDYLSSWASSVGLSAGVFTRPSQGKAKTIYISSESKKKGANTFLQFLKASRLLKNKHLPKKYMVNSREVRLQLLAGLIDSDGCKEGVGYTFSNKNEGMMNDVQWLARSLGFNATKKPKVVNGETYFTVGIYGDVSTIPVKIARKKHDKSQVKPKSNGLNFGFTITEEPNKTDYFGIQVDQDSLYLLADFTVVHNTGKTTFLASEISSMCANAEGQVLWFNNEEQGEKVMRRFYQAVLGLTEKELFSDIEKHKAEFSRLTKGNFRLIDEASLTKGYIEKVIKQTQPSLVIFDQIDKIKGFDADRKDLAMGMIYQWAREIAKTYAPVIAVCQADGTGEGVKWLTMGHVADAKTAKQAEADWILGIGKSNDEGFEYMRYLNISKNKLSGDDDSDPSLRHGRFEVIIEPQIARYKDVNYS